MPEGALDKYRELSNKEIQQYVPGQEALSDKDGDGLIAAADLNDN